MLHQLSHRVMLPITFKLPRPRLKLRTSHRRLCQWCMLNILGRPAHEIRLLIAGYRLRYGRDLVEAVKFDLSGKTERMFIMALNARRPPDTLPVDPKQVAGDVETFHSAAKKREEINVTHGSPRPRTTVAIRYPCGPSETCSGKESPWICSIYDLLTRVERFRLVYRSYSRVCTSFHLPPSPTTTRTRTVTATSSQAMWRVFRATKIRVFMQQSLHFNDVWPDRPTGVVMTVQRGMTSEGDVMDLRR
ncbi:uncharacterized protein LACBIDRAFT_304553 [Laccaria bicolor S238N-H82]|uniref:Predicted protein n=1 Tax=Laccaria bicolor (strain S238N-H82 / ATCC MYA-4686) TaxID=486041 RepID=B0DLW3_LACBS|nr:uncharacterized protein LACBIDRAFT_304553 [Laccaria bicolor S238N-H82]EDR04466.1 predicted protein [Laccaria bicolor S238N-H82]|eukprot:XP_001884985.1 predicted protein [Laccaria bicolor S238N-H82]